MPSKHVFAAWYVSTVAKTVFSANACTMPVSGVHTEQLVIANPIVQMEEKNEPKVNLVGSFLNRVDRRSPAVEKSIIGGMFESLSKAMIGWHASCIMST